jgi:hypothetical protein
MIFSWHRTCKVSIKILSFWAYKAMEENNLDDNDSLDIDSLGTSPVQGRKLAPSGKRTLGGRPAFDAKKQAAFASQPIERKAEILKRQWANIGYILLCQAERFSQSVTKKDFGRLMQLLSSAGIAYDKVVPKGEVLGSLTFNLFKGLEPSKLNAVLGQSQHSPQANQPITIDSTTHTVE